MARLVTTSLNKITKYTDNSIFTVLKSRFFLPLTSFNLNL